MRLPPCKLKRSSLCLVFIPPAIDALAPDPSFYCAEYAQNGDDEDPGIPAHTEALEAERRELIIVGLLATKRGITCKVPDNVAVADALMTLVLSPRAVAPEG